MEWRMFVLLFLCFHLKFVSTIDQASFYGSSYISLPFEEAKSSTDINFKFRTLLPNSLLLLVAGTTDYCIVQLENSRIKININLGAGESELLSPHNLKLNDLKWHEIIIIRHEANLSMIIDNTHKVQKRLPGRFFELNIHYGLFVGGHGNFSEIFFGHIDNFRGCLAELNYNGIAVLEHARHRQLESIVQRITWSCAAEFDASIDQPISFVEDDAYITLQQQQQNPHMKEFQLQFDIKTINSQGILYFNSGHGVKLDYFLIEIWKNTIRIIIKTGTKYFELINDERVSDGRWHKIFIHITSILVEIVVDNHKRNEKNIHGHLFQLSDTYYFGGLEISKRSRAISKGCKFCDVSFKGCLKNILINDKQKGFPDIHISEGLLPGCVWQYPCLQNPCKDEGICIQQGLNSFQCQCKDEFCIKLNYTEGYKVFSKNSLATELELLAVEPLKVLEGQNAIITTTNLHMILDYKKYGIKDSGINFHIIEGPSHGSITIDVWPHEKNSFSLFDIARDKVHYIHDGTEYHQDILILDVEFSPMANFILPAYLQGRFRFTLSITIIPVNDPPQLSISDSTVLRIVQGTKRIIDSEILKVKDPDSSSDQIVYNILESKSGHFENNNNEGVYITSFTQNDLNNNKILFIQDNNNNINDSYISLQVSDGIETSPISKIRVSISPQYWRLENNTGLNVLHQNWAIISPFNLSFTSNINNNEYKIQFFVIKKPNYGIIEIEKNVNLWEPTEVFTNIDIKQHRVRYRHTTSSPEFDEFQFRLNVDKSGLYTFRITFVKCSLYNININPIILNGTWETALSTKYLSFQTQPIKTLTTSIHYFIASTPIYGYLFSSISKYRLKTCDMFSQEDIVSKNIRYKFHQKPYSFVNDSFSFIVISPGCNNITGDFNIIYYPTNNDRAKVNFISLPLRVNEGDSSVINTTYLDIKTNIDHLIFNITKKPKNGFLQVKFYDNLRNNTNFFTLNELKLNQVFYKHDSSETENDQFGFTALSINDENFEFVGDFVIEITLKNDNSPIRAVDKVFNVVVGGERLLTGNDLKYIDYDLNTKPSEIVYTCRELSNGNFYFVSNQTNKVTEFTQDDLDKKRILFKHKGPEYAKIRLWITDGQFHVNGILEIQASAPFIHIFTKRKLVVQQGKTTVINNQHLTHSTNVYASDADVVYEIINYPTYGKVVLTTTLTIVRNFTQEDINSGLISYINEISTANADEIGLRVRCRDAVNVAQLGVWLLPSSYWEPFHIKRANRLSVEESTSVVITKNILEVSQQNVPSSSIIFYLNQPPDDGYISVLSDSKNPDYEPINVQHFTQDLINENRVLYIQSVANQTSDKIVFNITNGMIWHNNLVFRIEIIPEHIQLGSNIINVNEGETVTITPSYLFVITEFYKNKIKEYTIVQKPKYGCVQVHKHCTKLNSFSHKELLANVVSYNHDGTENLHDDIKIVAISNQKRSQPVVLEIKILPVNDQKPKLINNTGLVMWEGGIETITNSMLAAIDEDLPGDTLKYRVLNCWWGSVSLKTDLTTPINHFTQELIDKEMIVFQHQNGTETKFIFNISDGLHTTKDYTFHVKTKPVQLKLYSKSLHIFPMQRKYLTSSHLLSIISDPTRIVWYEITVPPTLGRLMMESESSGIFKIVSKFTQNDLNNSRVFYEHTHQFSDLYANDSFTFNVHARLVPILYNQVLKIDISISSGGLDAYVNIPKITVDEGGDTNIPLNISGVITFLENLAGLRSPVIHTSANQPQHGEIFLQNNRNITIFTQQQLESGQVYYQHDHSDSLGDNIHFSLYLIPGYVVLCNITVPITINPINDQPFHLVTPAPSLTVVQGENFTITRNELATEDADTPPSGIKYIVISSPKQGYLILLPNQIPIMYFTQQDIDNKLLVYIHNSSILTDSFHFRVWDEKFRPQFFVFNIIVLPINLTINSGLPVYLQQGSDVVFLSEKQFFVETNANKSKIKYTIKLEPKHGVLYVKDTPSTVFTQIDVRNDNVMYLQTDMTTANDSFKVLGEIISGNTSIGNEIDVIIKVQPLMQIRNFTVITGDYNKITLQVLDATPLAKLTNSNPRYTITGLPQYCQIRKVIRSSGEKRNVLNTVIMSFTHEEIQSGLIYLVVKDIELPWGGIEDRLSFLLAASIFQPALGDLRVNIRSSITNDIHSTLAGPSDPAGHEGGLHYASPNMTRDYFLIVSMVVGVVILGIAVIIVIKCRSFERDELNKDEQCLQPIPLPRPPDRLLTSSPQLKQQVEGYTPTLPTALPQCKVTPLGRNDLESHACYPYGVDDHPDDWSSCDASDPACPTKNIMLRRNQYWV